MKKLLYFLFTIVLIFFITVVYSQFGFSKTMNSDSGTYHKEHYSKNKENHDNNHNKDHHDKDHKGNHDNNHNKDHHDKDHKGNHDADHNEQSKGHHEHR